MIQMSQFTQADSWDINIPKTGFQLDYLAPKDLRKVIGLLKQQQIATLKIKFSFLNEYDRKIFMQLLKQEENDEYFREGGKKQIDIKSDKLKRKEMGFKQNGFIFQIGSRLKSEIFLRAYRGNKLDELQRNCNIKVQHFGRDIYIESDSKIRKGSIVHSELLDMYKRLKLFIFFNDEKLWNVVTNSEEFKKRLQKVGIYSYTNLGKRKHVAFYSFEYEPEEIRKQILRENSFQPRVLKLEDNQLSVKDNLRIFDVVVKSIRPTIDLIRNTYEANLQINKKNSCFVLHLKHEVFAEEPVAEISATVSNLFIISFSLRNCRSFINQLKRNPKKYPFINATHYNKTTFCCIDRTKVKNKKDILSVFAPFLEGLEQSSKLVLHLKPNCVLQQNSTIPSQILDLAQKFRLEVQDYEKIMNAEKFNIVIKPKLFNSESKKGHKQMEFSKFLLQLLMLQQNQKQVTQDELNQSILDNSMITQENTDESGSSQRNGRGNRNKARSKQEKNMFIEKFVANKNEQVVTIRKDRRQGRGNRNNQKESKYVEDRVSDRSPEFEPLASHNTQEVGWEFVTDFQKPAELETDQLFKKQKKDAEMEEAIQNKEGVKVKCWKLKVNLKKYGFPQNYEEGLLKQKCFLAENISLEAELGLEIKYRKLGSLQDKQIGYLVYKTLDGKRWVPTHMIQRFQG